MPLITVVSPLFPIKEEPYRGNAIYQTVLELQRHADVEVLCPTAVYPPLLGPRFRYHHGADRSYRPEGVSVEYIEYPAIPILSRPLNPLMAANRLLPRMERLNPDLILSYWLYPEGNSSILLGRWLNKPLIVGARGFDLRRIPDSFTRRKVRKTLQAAESVLTVSRDMRGLAIRMGVSPRNIHVIPNGIRQAMYHYSDPHPIRQRLGIRPSEKIILFVGGLSPSKGLRELLAAFQILAAEDPNVRLLIGGEGSGSAYIREFSRSHGLDQRITQMGCGSRQNVADWMTAADVFCLPSHSEGCPNVVIEAISCGCPVVGTNVGGIPELLTPECGILVEGFKPETLASALREGLTRKWDRRAISTVYSRTWADVADETFEVCRAVLDRKAARTSRMKVAVVTPYFPIAEEPYRGHSAFHTLRHMRQVADIEVFCPLATYPRMKWLTPRNFRYHRPNLSYQPPDLSATYFEYPALPVISRPINGLICAHYLKRFLEEYRPDVILNYWVYPEGFSALRIGTKVRIPVIVGSIGSDLRRIGDFLTERLVRYTLTNASAVITVSEELRKRAITLGVSPERVTTVLNGFDSTMFHPADQAAARRELEIAEDLELVLYVGWISPTKGLSELLQAIAGLCDSHPHLRVALIGEGTYTAEMQRDVAAAGCTDRFLFLGRMPSSGVATWMTACDLFCLPSHSEGCPNVVVEALASGRPVVATAVGGIPEIVNDESGMLVPARDPAKLQEAIALTLSRPWDQHHIARQFHRSWEDAARETYEVCRRVLNWQDAPVDAGPLPQETSGARES